MCNQIDNDVTVAVYSFLDSGDEGFTSEAEIWLVLIHSKWELDAAKWARVDAFLNFNKGPS